jgi:hypothetical protein
MMMIPPFNGPRDECRRFLLCFSPVKPFYGVVEEVVSLVRFVLIRYMMRRMHQIWKRTATDTQTNRLVQVEIRTIGASGDCMNVECT